MQKLKTKMKHGKLPMKPGGKKGRLLIATLKANVKKEAEYEQNHKRKLGSDC